ncbi:membrane hypothetical protein [Vibrio coralliirubri]|uniref:O-antigen polymerase n=1 Tax=Vibrio coralliirubri TaxID=1516159 RepID=A0AA87C2R1_9VIBR|nr:hypothetical protein [Vibrio coralliirubri]CDU10777.1 membrane hypothetical protein [Vibrio coralliirubri]
MNKLIIQKEFFSYLTVFILTAIIAIPSYMSISLFPFVVFIVGVIALLYRISLGLAFFLISIVASSDIAYNLGKEDSIGISSIFTTSIGPINLSVLWTLIIVCFLFSKELKNRELDKRLFLISSFLVVYSVLGVQYIGLQGSRWISDFAYFVNAICGITIVKYLIDTRYQPGISRLFEDTKLICMVFSSKMLIQTLHALYILREFSFTNYLSESGIYLSCFFIPFVIVFRNKFKSNIVFYLCLFTPMLANFISAARGRVIIILFSIIVTLVILRKVKILIYIVPVVILSFFLVQSYAPEYFNYMLWKMTSFEIGGDSSQSSTVRFIEFVNILMAHFEKGYSLLIGLGFGSYFDSTNYPFPFGLYGTGSYPDVWIQNDTFFKPHGSWQFIFMKFGLLGFLIVFAYLPILAYRKFVLLMSSSTEKGIMLASLASIIPLYLTNFTSKLQIMSALIVGIIIYLKVNNE